MTPRTKSILIGGVTFLFTYAVLAWLTAGPR